MYIFKTYYDDQLQKEHTYWKQSNQYSRILSNNKQVFTSLKLPDNAVLFNMKGRHYIEAMFYTDLPAYNFIPSYEQYIELCEKNKTIAVFRPVDYQMPDYLLNDSTVILLNDDIVLCE